MAAKVNQSPVSFVSQRYVMGKHKGCVYCHLGLQGKALHRNNKISSVHEFPFLLRLFDWKYGVFLDSGNIISDQTFYAQSQEKVPEFSGESLCLRQGMATIVAVGVT